MEGLVNKQQLAALQGVSLPTISAWMQEGMPVAEKGGRGKGYSFDPSAVTAWRVKRAEDKARQSNSEGESEAAAKRRKTAAEADFQELKVAQLRGELCLQADLVSDIQNDLAKVRARLLAIPYRAAPMVVGLSENAARKFLSDLIHEALEELTTVSAEDFFDPYDRNAFRELKFVGTTIHAGRFTVRLRYDSKISAPLAPESVDFGF